MMIKKTISSFKIRLQSRGYIPYRVWYAYLFIIGVLVFVTIFIIIPMLLTFIIGLFNYSGFGSARFIGLENYREIISDKDMWRSIWVNIQYLLGTLPFTLVISFVLSLIITEKWFKGKQIAIGIFFSPYVLPFVGAGFIWSWLMNPMTGVINYLLNLLGLNAQYWFRDPALAMISVCIVAIWKFLGFQLILYIAAIQNIPDIYYEAAKIDGVANKWQEIKYITFPLTLPTTFFLLIMGVIGAFKAFNIIFVTTQGGPVNATRILIYYIYEKAFNLYQFGVGSAMSFLLFLLLLIVTYSQWNYYKNMIEN